VIRIVGVAVGRGVAVGPSLIHVPPSIFEHVNPLSHLPGLFPQQGLYSPPQGFGVAVNVGRVVGVLTITVSHLQQVPVPDVQLV